MTAPIFKITEVQLLERAVSFRPPFGVGSTPLSTCPEAFVRVRIESASGEHAWGAAADMMLPKWFDKSPKRSDESNIADLRTSLAVAQQNYLSNKTARSAYGHFAAYYESQLAAGALLGLRPLAANFGPAMLDRAVIDAVCRMLGVSVFQAVRENALGIAPANLARALGGFNCDAFLASLTPRMALSARHSIGLNEPITQAQLAQGSDDAQPLSLEAVIAAYSPTHFSIRLSGDTASDIDRLSQIATLLEPRGLVKVTLDGNEQFDDLHGLNDFLKAFASTPALARMGTNLLYIEQPIHRASAYDTYVGGAALKVPIMIDESDSDLDAFPRAKRLGYMGVSAKSCKGFYRSVINAMRCAQWNGEAAAENRPERYFLSAEDNCLQHGLGMQQDFATAALLGLAHTQRNGHHWVNGMAALSDTEQRAWLAAHADLYEVSHGAARLKIRAGQVALGSLDCVGFGSAAEPDWASMQPMQAS
jgi:L-alanine-DL-glutamate epimerase-like enolase superfamily enzyme